MAKTTTKAAKAAKTTKAAKAAKTTTKGNGKAAKAATVQRERRTPYTADQRIKLLVDGNPRRAGSATYDIFAVYKNGMRVEDFFAKSANLKKCKGRMVDLHADVERGHIAIK